MGKKKFKKDERRWLKKAGFGRGDAGMGGLACALHEVETGPRSAGYCLQADSICGQRIRRRVRRERWNRRARCLRRMLLLVAVYVGSLAVVVLLAGAVYEFLLRFVG